MYKLLSIFSIVYLALRYYYLKKLIKQTGYGEKIYIGMGAGSISNWMRNL